MSSNSGKSDESEVLLMVFHCWRDGKLGISPELPEGAIELARGRRALLRGLLLLARDAGQPKGVDQLPGIAPDMDDAEVNEVLRMQLFRLECLVGGGVSFNKALDSRFVGQG